ncbi:MAG: sugar phosphate isomerase/epimerase family protein [Christensenellales bacterium]|jgi:D-psicose/D-tagatose/L-ribulose 3-epimerase
MEYGLCINMVARDAEGIGMHNLPAMEKAGFDFVEIPVMKSMALSRSQFTELVVKPLEDQPLPCKVMNSYSGPDLLMIGPQADKDKVYDYTCEAMDRASMLGAETVVFGSGVSRATPVGMSREKGLAELMEVIRMTGDEAQKRGITLAVEQLNRQETNVLYTLPEAAQFVSMVDHENVGLLVDYFHFTLGGEDYAYVEKYAGLLTHTHFARMMGRVLPVDEREDTGYRAFLRALIAGGYNKTISMEANCASDLEETAARSLQMLRGIVDSLLA